MVASEMTKRSKGNVWKSFHEEVEEHFGPVAAALRLQGEAAPERVPGVRCMVYGSPPLTYRVCLVMEDHAVLTAVHLVEGGRTLVADLDKLVTAAGLGSWADVPTSAHTLHNLRGTLAAQAGWVRRLHPTLAGPGGAGLLRSAEAKVWWESGTEN